MARKASSLAQAERDLVRRCHSGLDVGILRHQVLQSLRRLMPVDAAFFATADPMTLLFTGAHAEEPLSAATPLLLVFLDNEVASNDVNKFALLATSPTHVASLDGATRRDRPSSPRYRDIMRPLGLGDELRAALITGSECGVTCACIGWITRSVSRTPKQHCSSDSAPTSPTHYAKPYCCTVVQRPAMPLDQASCCSPTI